MSQLEQSSAVTYAESHKIMGKRVGEFLKKEFGDKPQFVLASVLGTKPYGPAETDKYSFLLGTRRERYCFGLFSKPRPLIARLILHSDTEKPDRKRWVICVYGRTYIQFLSELANKLATEFMVSVHVRLESEQVEYEWEPPD